MNKFSKWLDSEPGLATKLATKLKVNTTNPSNVKNERRPIPVHWFPIVVAMSKGKISFEDLTRFRIKVAKAILIDRKPATK